VTIRGDAAASRSIWKLESWIWNCGVILLEVHAGLVRDLFFGKTRRQKATYDWQQRCNGAGVPLIRTPEFLDARRLSWRQFGRRADSRFVSRTPIALRYS